MAARSIATRAAQPNLGLEMALYRELEKLTARMVADVEKKLNPPVSSLLALDATLTGILRTLANLREKWRGIWDEEGRRTAEVNLKQAYQQGTSSFQRALRDAGLSVRLRLTPGMQDTLDRTLRDNVEMITNIPTELFDSLEHQVRRSIEGGRSISELKDYLRDEIPSMSRRRARLVANNQNNRMTAAMTNTRQQELGLMAKWRHSGAWKTRPRRTHVAFNKTVYDPAGPGLWDEDFGGYVLPGQLPNCRCTSITVLPATLAR